MRAVSALVALATVISSVSAAGPYQGFNYGNELAPGVGKKQADWEKEFRLAQALPGAPGNGFTSARLFTSIQMGSASDPIEAIPAAIATKTSLLLTLWISGGNFLNELQAVKTAAAKYGDKLAPYIAGISVGSEDLYRISKVGMENPNAGPGVEPSKIAGYIRQVREAIKDTPLKSAPIGHVDTWTAWVDGSNRAVIDACDWIGMDAYPYWQNTSGSNAIENSKALFEEAVANTKAAVGSKDVWITETGFPISGIPWGQAKPGPVNAKSYWDQVGCPRFGKTSIWWFSLQYTPKNADDQDWGVVSNAGKLNYDISCKKDAAVSSAAPSSTPASSTPSRPSSTTAAGSGGGSGTGSGSGSSTVGTSGPVSSATTTVINSNPGGGAGSSSSQLSGGVSSATSSASRSLGTGPSASVSVPGSGSNSTAAPSGTPTPSIVPGSAGVRAISGSIGAAFAAVIIAVLAT